MPSLLQTDEEHELWPFYFENFDVELPTLQKLLYCGLHEPLPELKRYYKGKFYYRRRAIQMIWSREDVLWHSWIDRMLRSWCDYNWITWTGPAASGKSLAASLFALEYWMEEPDRTSVIMASTTKGALARRLWYYVQDLHSKIPPEAGRKGEPIYSEYLIRWRAGDKKNGIFGVAVEDGPIEEALHNLIGFHNKRVVLIVDEAPGVREALFQACDNLSKNPEFKCVLMGNAESREDPHGRFSEPLGGWVGIDPNKDEQWETQGGVAKGNGVCVFFDGRKSPAVTEPEGPKTYPFLINQDQIDAALDYYKTEDDPRFWSQSIGFWPPVTLKRTVLDERIVLNNFVKEPATWYTSFRWCAAFDPSYEGGDRKIFQPFKLGQLGPDQHSRWQIEFSTPVELKISIRDEHEIHYQIVQQCIDHCELLDIPPDRFGLGSSGEGGGLLSIFRREWGAVHGIEEAGAVSNRPISNANPKPCSEEYDRVVTELWFGVREFAIHGCLRGMPEEALREFYTRRWEIQNHKVRLETKKELKKHFRRSPDYGDAVAFCIELARRLGAIAGNPDLRKVDPWGIKIQEEYDNMILDEDAYAYAGSMDHKY
jgi:hypothetical protein